MEILVESAQAITQFFREQGYTEESLSRLGLVELSWNSPEMKLASAWAVTGKARLDQATELIAELGLAITLESTFEEIEETIHAHPTLSEAIHLGEAIAKSQGEKFIGST